MHSRFTQAFLNSGNQFGFSVLVLLTWVATCDGQLDAEERDNLRGIAQSLSPELDLPDVINATSAASLADLQLACEVARHMKSEKRALFLQLAIGIAIADGVLRPTENQVLRFLSDLIGLSARDLRAAYREITQQELPIPRDLSDPTNRSRSQRQRSHGSQRQNAGPTTPRDTKRIQSLAVLGLEEGASPSEVKLAYRRLAKIHHPDRYESLGVEAVRAATLTFQRIQAAYEYLSA